MSAFTRLISSASLICLLNVATASAANTTWDFSFGGAPIPQPNAAPPGVALGLRINPPAGISGGFLSPDGRSAGNFFNNDLGTGAGQSYPTFSQFQSSNTNPAQGTWSLTTGQSQYQFTPDFSAITPASIPLLAITSPVANATTDAQPTLQWSLTGTPNAEIVQITNADLSVNETFFGLIPTSTSFTLPSALPVGTYTFFLSWSAAAVPVPITTTHIAGPTLTITPNGTFQSSGEVFESFTVVPEPTILALLTPLSLLLLRRRAH